MSAGPIAGVQPAPSVAVPAGLPDRFGIGLTAAPGRDGLDGWVPESGSQWDYVSQYLTGGANTGRGWQSWGPNGRFPIDYAQKAARVGAVPVFTHYQVDASAGPCTPCDVPQRKNFANLNDAGVMRAYFEDFALLMKRLGTGTHDGIAGYGKSVIVHVEPDLSGFAMQATLDSARCYGFCTAQQGHPSNLKAAVSSTGIPEVAGLPDTYQGFSWALLKLRDAYAPNVRLGYHFSLWASLHDIGTNTSASLDAVGLGRQVGTFAALSGAARTPGFPSGLSTYDLLFNDVADHDAAYAKHVMGVQSAWWDRYNATFPNFHRWEKYVAAVASTVDLPVIAWQVPAGNQRYLSMNNTRGHYQDNRAEYFFEHVDELVAAGIIGVMFANGDGAQTARHDGMGDGVTNPEPVCTTDGVSRGQICTGVASELPDDDGGFIRLSTRAYYAAGARPLGGLLSLRSSLGSA